MNETRKTLFVSAEFAHDLHEKIQSMLEWAFEAGWDACIAEQKKIISGIIGERDNEIAAQKEER